MLTPSLAAATRRRRADSGERRTLTVRFSAGVADFGDAIDQLYEQMFVDGCDSGLNPRSGVLRCRIPLPSAARPPSCSTRMAIMWFLAGARPRR